MRISDWIQTCALPIWIAPVDGVLNVWVAPAGNVADARAVTDDDARGIRQYFWSYQPDTLLYLRDNGGDENFHLHAVDLASGESRHLTPYEKTRSFVTRVSHLHPDSVLVGMNDRTANWQEIDQAHVSPLVTHTHLLNH